MWSQVCLVLTFCTHAAMPGCHSRPLLLNRGVEELRGLAGPVAHQLPAPGLTYAVGNPRDSYIAQPGGCSYGECENPGSGTRRTTSQPSFIRMRLMTLQASVSLCQWTCWMKTSFIPTGSSGFKWDPVAAGGPSQQPAPQGGCDFTWEAWGLDRDCGKLPRLLLGRGGCDWGLLCWPSG